MLSSVLGSGNSTMSTIQNSFRQYRNYFRQFTLNWRSRNRWTSWRWTWNQPNITKLWSIPKQQVKLICLCQNLKNLLSSNSVPPWRRRWSSLKWLSLHKWLKHTLPYSGKSLPNCFTTLIGWWKKSSSGESFLKANSQKVSINFKGTFLLRLIKSTDLFHHILFDFIIP